MISQIKKNIPIIRNITSQIKDYLKKYIYVMCDMMCDVCGNVVNCVWAKGLEGKRLQLHREQWRVRLRRCWYLRHLCWRWVQCATFCVCTITSRCEKSTKVRLNRLLLQHHRVLLLTWHGVHFVGKLQNFQNSRMRRCSCAFLLFEEVSHRVYKSRKNYFWDVRGVWEWK